MTPLRWQQIQDLLESTLELPESERAGFLAHSCNGDESLREEVEAMLVVDTQLGDFIEKPLFSLHSDHGSLAPGDRLGSWQIVSEIGKGGMGAVYLAERADAAYEKKAAVKLLKRGMDTDELVRRFRAERRILARLDHPHIAHLLDGGSTPDGRPYLVMEHVEGRPIDAWCTERGVSTEDRLVLFEKVCRAVHFAHRNLVVHRDLKPGNILVGADGEPRLLDFGIAKLLEGDPEPHATVMAYLPMTPEFASPEQIRGEPVTTATDVYSLGVLLYRLLARRSPYRPATEGRAALAEAVCSQEPQRPSTVVGARVKEGAESAHADRLLAKRLRGDLDTIVKKAMSKDPSRRYESAEQLAADIRRHLEGLPVLARSAGVGYRTSKFVGRHKVGVALAAAALVAIIGTAAVAVVQRAEALREKTRAEEAQTQAENAQDRAEKAQVRADWASDFLTKAFEINNPSESRGKEIKAIELLEKAREQLSTGDVQPEMAARLAVVLGKVYGQLGQYGTARELYEKALDLNSKNGTGNGPGEAGAILGLAQVESDLGNDAEAENLMKKGLALRGRPGATENTDYVEALNNYGGLLLNAGRLEDAEKLFRRALDVEQVDGRSKDRTVVIALSGLGELEWLRRRFSEAEKYFRRSLDLRRQVFGEPSVEVAKTLNSLATVLEDLHRYQEAEDFYVSSIAMRKTVLGPAHPKLAPPLSNLARLYEEQGKWRKVEDPYREAVAICSASGNEDRKCGIYLSHLASFLAERVGCGEAELMAGRAITLLEDKSAGQEALAEAQSVLGACRTAAEDFASAEPLLLQALSGTEKAPSTSLVRRRILARLVRLYEAWGKPDPAAKYRTAVGAGAKTST